MKLVWQDGYAKVEFCIPFFVFDIEFELNVTEKCEALLIGDDTIVKLPDDISVSDLFSAYFEPTQDNKLIIRLDDRIISIDSPDVKFGTLRKGHYFAKVVMFVEFKIGDKKAFLCLSKDSILPTNGTRVRLEFEDSDIIKFKCSMSSDVTKYNLTITTRGFPVIGATINKFGIDWVSVSASLNQNGTFDIQFVPAGTLMIANTFAKADFADHGTFVSRTTMNPKPAFAEEPFLSAGNVENICSDLSGQLINFLKLYEDVAFVKLSGSNIKFVSLGEILNQDPIDISDSFYPSQRAFSFQPSKVSIGIVNSWKKAILPIEIDYCHTASNANLDVIKTIGASLVVSNTDDDGFPCNRFFYMYQGLPLYITWAAKVYGVENGQFKIIDDQLIYVPPPPVNPKSALDPGNIVRLITDPDVPYAGTYYDSLLPSLVTWRDLLLPLAYRDNVFYPVNMNLVFRNVSDEMLNAMNVTLMWVKSIANFQLLGDIGYDVKAGFYYSASNGVEFELGQEISPKNLLLVHRTFVESVTDLVESYINGNYLPPFEIGSLNQYGYPTGFYYLVKFTNKQVREQAMQGYVFKSTVQDTILTIDLNSMTWSAGGDSGSISVIYSNDRQKWLSLACDITPQRLKAICILPPKDKQIKDLVLVGRISNVFFMFQYEAFFGKPFFVTPVATTREIDKSDFSVSCSVSSNTLGLPDDLEPGTVVMTAKTYRTLRSIVEPVIKDRLVLQRITNVDDVEDILKFSTSELMTSPPYLVKFNGKTYMLTDIEISYDGEIAQISLSIDDRNEFYSEFSEEPDDESPKTAKFELMRRFMNPGVPGEFIWRPSVAIDEFLKTKIKDVVEKVTYQISTEIEFDIPSLGTPVPDVATTLDGIAHLPDESHYRFICLFDCSGISGSDSNMYYTARLPMQMTVDKSVYVGVLISRYVLCTSEDVKNSVTATISGGNAKFVYPDSSDSIELDLFVDVPSFLTAKISASERGSISLSEVTKLIKDNVLISFSGLIDKDVKIDVFSLRPDNDMTFVLDREKITVTNVTTGQSWKLTDDTKREWGKYLKASYTFGETPKEVQKVFNANSLVLGFLDQETKDQEYVFKIDIPIEYPKEVTDYVNPSELRPFLYIKSNQIVDVIVGGTTYKVGGGVCQVIPIYDKYTDAWNPTASVIIDNVKPGNVIEIYFVQLYSVNGFTIPLSTEEVG